MSRNVEERVVEMQFDNKSFEANCKTTLASIEQLNKTLEATNHVTAFANIQNGINKFDLSSISSGVDSLVDKFSLVGMTGVKILDEISDKAIEVGKTLWNNTIGQIQQGGKQRALNIANAQFTLKGLGIAWEEVSDDIDYAVSGTAFGLDAAANAASQFAASGVELGDDMKAALRGISGVAAMTNSSYEDIARVFTAAAGKGKVQAMEMNRIALRGINVAGAMAKQWGITEQEVRELAEAGEISFQMFADAMDAAFGEHAKEANQTYVGSLANVKAALSRIGEIFYTPILDSQIQVNNKLRESIDNVKNAMKPAEGETEAFSTRFDRLAHLVSDVSAILIERLSPATEAIRAKLEPINNAMDKANEYLTSFKEYLGKLPGVASDASDEAGSLADEMERITAADKEIALHIWNFSDPYGNGQQRIDALGDSYDRVQTYINTFIESGYDVAKTDELLGISAAEATEDVESLNTALSKGADSFKFSMFEKLRIIFTNISTAASNISTTVVGTVKALMSAFGDVFSIGQATDDLVHFSEIIVKITEALKPTERGFENIKRTFRGVIAVFDILYQAVRAVFNGVLNLLSPLIGGVDKFGGNIFEVTGTIGDFIFAIDEAIKEGNIFGKAFDKIVEIIKNFPTYFKTAASAVKDFASNGIDKLSEMTGIDFKGIFKTIADSVKGAAKAFLDWSGIDIHEIVDNIKSWAKELWSAIKSGDYKKALNMLWSGVKNVFGGIALGMKKLGATIKEAILNSGIGGPIKKFLSVLSYFKDKVLEILGTIFGGSDKKTASGERSVGAAGNSHVVKAIKKETSALEMLKEVLATLWGGLKAILKSVYGFITGANGGISIWSLLSDLVTGIAQVFKAAGFESIRDAIAFFEVDKLLTALLNFSYGARKLSSGISKTLRSLRGFIRAKKIAVYVGLFKTIAKSMLMIAGAIVILGYAFEKYPDGISYSFALLEVIILELTLISTLMAQLGHEYGEIKVGAIAGVITSLGYCMILMAISFKMIAKSVDTYGTDSVLVTFGTIGSILLGFSLFAAQMSRFGTAGEFTPLAIAKSAKVIKAVGWAMLMMAGSFAIIQKVATGDPSAATQAWAVMVTMFAGMVAVVMAISVLAESQVATGERLNRTILSVAAVLLALATAMDMIAPAIILVGAISAKNALQGCLALIVMLGAIFGALIGLNKIPNISSKKLLAAAGAIAIVSLSLISLVPPIIALGNMDLDKVGIGLLEVFGGLSAIVLALIGTTHAAKGGPAGMLAAAGAIAIISLALQGLAPAIGLIGSLSLPTIAKGLSSIAIFLASVALISKLVNPVAAVALGGSLFLIATSVLFLAKAFLTGTKALIMAAAASKLIEGFGAKAGHEVGMAIVEIANVIINNAGTIALAISMVAAEVLATLALTILSLVPALAEILILFLYEVLKVVDKYIGPIAELIGEIAVKLGVGIIKGIVNGILYELGISKKEVADAWNDWLEDVLMTKEERLAKAMREEAEAEKKQTEEYEYWQQYHIDAWNKGIRMRMEKQQELIKKYGENWRKLATEEELLEAELTDAQKEFLNKRTESMSTSISDSIQSHADLFDKLTSVTKSKKDDLYDAGKENGEAVMNGTVNGILSKKAELERIANDTALTVPQKFRSVLQIKSPSKVMEKNGEYTVQGLIDGIDGMEDDLGQTTDDLANNVKSAFDTGLDDNFSDFSISDSFNDAFDDEELTITPVWDQTELSKGIDDIDGLTSDLKVGGLSTSGFDLSSFVNDQGNLSFDMANMDGLLNSLNLDSHFGNLENSNYNLAGAIDSLSGNIFDMNNKETVIENVINLDGYNIAAATAPYSDSIMGDRQSAVDRGMSPIEYQARVARNGYSAGNVYDAGIINTNPNNRSGLGYGLSTARNIISKTYKR